MLPGFLREAGLKVECLSAHFTNPQTTEDVEWIPYAAQKNWLIVTSDKDIEDDPVNRSVVVDAKARVVVLDENNSKAIVWASALIVSREKLYRLLMDYPQGPWYVTLSKTTGQLVSSLRIPGQAQPPSAATVSGVDSNP